MPIPNLNEAKRMLEGHPARLGSLIAIALLTIILTTAKIAEKIKGETK